MDRGYLHAMLGWGRKENEYYSSKGGEATLSGVLESSQNPVIVLIGGIMGTVMVLVIDTEAVAPKKQMKKVRLTVIVQSQR